MPNLSLIHDSIPTPAGMALMPFGLVHENSSAGIFYWNLHCRNLNSLSNHLPPLRHYPLSWACIGSSIFLPAWEKRWNEEQSAAIVREVFPYFVANPDNPSQTWLTVALMNVLECVSEFLEPIPAFEKSPATSRKSPTDIEWKNFLGSKSIQKIEGAWARSSWLSDFIKPSLSDQRLVDQIGERFNEISHHLCAEFGQGNIGELGRLQAILDIAGHPPLPLKFRLDQTVLESHMVSLEISPRQRKTRKI
jgi:hypothetical protein